MAKASVVYYVSSHGLGHARRSSLVADAMLRRLPELTVHFRTNAPAGMFRQLPAGRWTLAPADLDSGAAEDDPLTINPGRTLQRVRDLLADAGARVRREAQAIRDLRPRLLLSDAPFLAGDVAVAAGVDCWAVTNFTWDWIYQPLFAETGAPDARSLLDRIRESYGRMTGVLRLPLGGGEGAFQQIVDVPLVASASSREPERILAQLKLASNDGRPRILVGIRGGVSSQILCTVGKSAPDLLLLVPGAADRAWPGNVHPVQLSEELDFADLIRVSDAVVSKLGYGIIADCLAARKPLLWPPRTGFREDALAEPQAARCIPMCKLGRDDFLAGRWAPAIRALLAQPTPAGVLDLSGARQIAEEVARRI